MLTLELDENTEQALKALATKQGKTAEQWLKDMINQLVQADTDTVKPQRPIGLAKDKGVPLPDTFFEPLPDELLAAFNGGEH